MQLVESVEKERLTYFPHCSHIVVIGSASDFEVACTNNIVNVTSLLEKEFHSSSRT